MEPSWGVVDYPYQHSPARPAGPATMDSPDVSPLANGAAAGGLFGIDAQAATTGSPRACRTGSCHRRQHPHQPDRHPLPAIDAPQALR